MLTGSDELLEQVGQALDGAGEVRHAENEEEARQFTDPRHAAVILLDARDHVDPGQVVERLHAGDGTTVIVVFAPANSATDVAKAIKGSAAFAVLPVPIEMEKTRAVLQGAGEEALARRALVSLPAESTPSVPVNHTRLPEPGPVTPAVRSQPTARSNVVSLPVASEVLPTAGGGSRRTESVPRVAVVAVLSLLILSVAAWLYLRDDHRAPPESAPAAGALPVPNQPVAVEPPAPIAAVRPKVELSTEPKEELLDRARVAFHERRYTDPDGDNALYFYRSVLAQDPHDGEAREGLDRIGGVLEGRFKSALAEQRTDDAARTLEHLQAIRPGDPALAAAAAQLAEQRVGAALARGDVDQATELLGAADRAGVAPQRLAPLREQLGRLDTARRAERMSRLVTTRIREGQLLAPAGDSAKYYLGQLLVLPNGRRLGAAASDELARAFAERARSAASQGQGAEGERWPAGARALGYTPERTAAQLATAPTAPAVPMPQRTAEPVATARQDPPTTAAARVPTPEPAARPEGANPSRVAATPADTEVSAADFKRTRYVAPTYPPQALARGQSGEVRVRLSLGTDGRVASVQVLSGTPPGVFDQAAVSAVRKWRFEPVLRDGRAIEASVTTTIGFRPDGAAKR